MTIIVMDFSNKNNRKIIIISVILALGLLAIILGYYMYADAVNKSNALSRTNHGEDDYTSVEISPREGSSSRWISKMGDESYVAVIYDVTVYNNYEGDIRDWSLRIDITEDCYLNEAWSGDIEIHQFRNSGEHVERINLENYDIADVTSEYELADQDLAISLHSGDYLIYYASVEEEEDPITAKEGDATVGLIFYSKKASQNFNILTLNYHTYLDVNKSAGHNHFIFALVIWCFLLILFIVVLCINYISKKNLEVKYKQIEESLRVFIGFIDAKDHYTNGHSTRVATYSAALAKRLGLTVDECRDIYYIGLMHDCGKCYIPDEILKKPGRLAEDEYEIIKQHTVKGAELLKDFTSIKGIADGAMYHHERYDGSGYPTGKKGIENPLVARIIAVVDAYDIMKTGRLYCEPLPDDRLREELVNGSGTQFDPDIAAKFIEMLDKNELK